MISDKFKTLLRLTRWTETDFAQYCGMGAQSMHNKFSRGSFNMNDAIKIAEFTGAVLSFTLPDGQQITFDASDIREKD